MIADWQPEPLVPDTPEDHPALDPFVVEGKVCGVLTINFLAVVLQTLFSNLLGWQVCMCQWKRLPEPCYTQLLRIS